MKPEQRSFPSPGSCIVNCTVALQQGRCRSTFVGGQYECTYGSNARDGDNRDGDNRGSGLRRTSHRLRVAKARTSAGLVAARPLWMSAMVTANGNDWVGGKRSFQALKGLKVSVAREEDSTSVERKGVAA